MPNPKTYRDNAHSKATSNGETHHDGYDVIASKILQHNTIQKYSAIHYMHHLSGSNDWKFRTITVVMLAVTGNVVAPGPTSSSHIIL